MDSNWRPGDEEEYTLVDVKFPQGTKTHVLAATKAPSAPPSAAAPPPAARTLVRPPAGATARSDLQRQITVLKQLRDGGLITGQEFDFRKKGLLDRFVGAPKTATARLTAPESPPAALQAALAKYSGINFGRYYALVIGNNNYKYLPHLKTAAFDARAVADVLRETYGFDVTLLIDATRADIIEALDDFRETLDDTTNLLIYYAGHGWLDEAAGQGYWLPVDAKRNRRTHWVANSTITGTLRALNAKHVMVVADSCYSGTLVRGIKIKENTPDYIRRMAGKRARLALTSGGLEPVADSGGGKHSPFAAAFIDVLKANTSVIDGTQLFSQMRRPVILNSDQTPEYSDVRKAGHEGGDFLFVRRR
ncbi:MAG: caspase family protein, partial [Proteobacteria bacterium]|nr:caspase family protein [Pseudomonadota bacterium]